MPQRFFPRKTSKVVFAPSVASLAAPTRAEINAGTVLAVPGSAATEAISEMSGWSSTNNPINVPDLNSDFDKTIPGTFSAEQSSFTFYADLTAKPLRTAQAEGTFGYMILMWHGDVAGRPCQVWPVRVASNNDVPTLANEAHRFVVQYTPEQTPEKNAVVPA